MYVLYIKWNDQLILMKKQQNQGSKYQIDQTVLTKNEKKQQKEFQNQLITRLTSQNSSLRKKLKFLNTKLDEQIQKVANEKLKSPNKKQIKSLDNGNNELKNAYKMIDRLQKTIKQFQNKELYISVNKIQQLEDQVKSKDKQLEQIKVQLKILKKVNRQQEKHLEQLNQNKKINNPVQDKEQIYRLKQKIKKLSTQNQNLQKQNRNKHQKIVLLEKKTNQLQKQLEFKKGPIDQVELQNIKNLKQQYRQSVTKNAKQSSLLIKYKQKISELQDTINGMKDIIIKKEERKDRYKLLQKQSQSQKRQKSISNSIMKHIPSQHLTKRLKNEKGVFL